MTRPIAPPADANAAPQMRDVWELLAELHRRHTTLALRSTDSGSSGATQVLAVDAPRRLLLLEALRSPPSKVAAGETLHLETDLDDRRISIECRVDDVVHLADGTAYLAETPLLRLDESRRAGQRLHLPSPRLIDAAIRARDSANLPVQIVDVSCGGFGAQLSNAMHLPDGMKVNCTLDLPEVKVFVEATVRHTRTADGGVRVGLQFSEMTSLLESEMKLAMAQLTDRLQRIADDSAPGAPPPEL